MTLSSSGALIAIIVACSLLVAAAAEAAGEKNNNKNRKAAEAGVEAIEDASRADALVEEELIEADAEAGTPRGDSEKPGLDSEEDEPKINIQVFDDDDNLSKKGDVVLFGQNKTIVAGEVVAGDVVVVGGNLKIDGTVKGDAVCVGGNLAVGPEAEIKGDLVNVGGKSDVDPAAEVGGDRVNVVGVPLGILKHFKHFKGVDHDRFDDGKGFVYRLAKLISELVFFLFLLFLALLMTVFMPRQLGRIDDHLTGDFPRSALLGVAVMILLPLVLIILAVTIVGIPLIPLVLLAVAVTCFMGYIAFGKVLGRKLMGERHVMLHILVGLALLQGASILGDLIALPGGSFMLVSGIFRTIGTIIFIGGGFLGLGAVVYSRWGKRTIAQTRTARTPNGTNGTNGTNGHAAGANATSS